MKANITNIDFSKVIDRESVEMNEENLEDDFSEDDYAEMEVENENNHNDLPGEQVINNGEEIVQDLPGRVREDDEGYVTEDTAFVSLNYLGIDPASGLIEVFVHINQKENFILQRTATIGSLKQMIFERKGIPVDLQRLVFTGRILQDETTLVENRIECGSNIHMFIPIRGGITNNCNNENDETHSVKNLCTTDCV